MNDLDIHKLTGAYATDALDDLERARFEQHLAACEDCRAEVTELREAAARMATITEATPPESLRSSILAGIAQVRPLPPFTEDRSDDEDDDAGLPPAATRSAAPAAPDEPTRLVPGTSRRGLRRWAPALVAAVLALVAGVTLSMWQPWDSPAEQVLEAADAESVWVDLGEAGQAEVVRSNSEDRAVLVTKGMALPPEGRVYQLWYQPAGTDEMVPAGLMPRDEDNTVVLEGRASQAVTVGITVEPAGGSEKPTTDPIAVFDLTEAT